MLPRLLAEERLRGITDGAAAAGALERGDHRALIRKLEKDAEVRAPAPNKAGSAVLASMGIGVRGPDPDGESNADG